MFNNLPTFDFSAFATPVQKIADLNASSFTKAFDAQQATAKKLLTLSQERVKAALEIKDIEGYVAFVTEQTEINKSSVQELMESSAAATKDAEAYIAEVQVILNESQEAVANAAPALEPVAKKAPAKKAA